MEHCVLNEAVFRRTNDTVAMTGIFQSRNFDDNAKTVHAGWLCRFPRLYFHHEARGREFTRC